jgi:hypothetical protein
MKTFLALIGAAVVGIFCLGILATLFSSNHPNSNATVNQAGAVPDSVPSTSNEPPIDVSPYNFYASYHRNEVSADSMYKGRKLRVTGIVESINKDAFDETYLVLEDGDEFSGVQARLEASEVAQAGRLSIGNQVTMVCKGGTMIIGTPMLQNCIFGQAPTLETESTQPGAYAQPVAQSTPAAQTIPVAASALPVSANHDYQNKFLSVMQSHWVLPTGVPVDTHAEMKVDVAPDGRVYNGAVTEPSSFLTLDQSCLDALQQMTQFDPTPDGKGMQISFECRVTQ